MEGHVNVTILSRSRYEGGEDKLAFAGKGLLRREGEGWHLRYTAASPDGTTPTSGSPPLATGLV